MAQLKQCANGHYYDPSMYATCPYCSGASVGIDRSVAAYDIATSAPSSTLPGTVPSNPGEGATVAPDGLFTQVDDVTRPPEDHNKIEAYGGGTMPVNPFNTYAGKKQIKPEGYAAAEKPEQELPLRSVVGWLVAVEGPYAGKSFELHQAYNYIGREKGDIVLQKDGAVSTEKNAWVMYSAKNNRFKLGAGESTNIVYVNDDELSANSSVALAPYDLIEIGMSKFRFVSFCNENFKWGD